MAMQPEAVARFARIGMQGMSTRAGLQAFAAALAQQAVQIGVAAIDWTQYAAALPRSAPYLLLAGLEPTAREASPYANELIDFSKMTPQETRVAIEVYLLERVARVLRLDAARQDGLRAGFAQLRLNVLGLDSLMAIELRNRILADLAVDVPIHYFIGGSAVGDVVELVSAQLALQKVMQAEHASAADDADMDVCIL